MLKYENHVLKFECTFNFIFSLFLLYFVYTSYFSKYTHCRLNGTQLLLISYIFKFTFINEIILSIFF